jgi:hypothetical protein
MPRVKITPTEWCRARGIDLRLYQCWVRMRQRCTNPKNKDWKHYGGRGIKVSARWAVFENFEADMGPHPGKGWSIDRERNHEGYRDGNCRWATTTTQQRNRRSTRANIALANQIRAVAPRPTLRVLAARFNLSVPTISRILRGETWVQ